MTGEPTLTNRLDLPRVLGDDQIAHWLDDGYLVLPNLLAPDEIDELKREAEVLPKTWALHLCRSVKIKARRGSFVVLRPTRCHVCDVHIASDPAGATRAICPSCAS